jgi:hypothetical protein
MTDTMPPLIIGKHSFDDDETWRKARAYAEQVTKELLAEVEWLTEDRDQRRTDNEAMEAIVFGRYSNKDANAILTEARDVYVSIRERAERAEAEVERLRASKPEPAQEPVARLLTYVGKGTYPKRGYTVARTYEELSEGTYPESWAEGQRLYAAPLSDTAKQDRIDAERYRMLRSPTLGRGIRVIMPTPYPAILYGKELDAELDAAIDAALEAEVRKK